MLHLNPSAGAPAHGRPAAGGYGANPPAAETAAGRGYGGRADPLTIRGKSKQRKNGRAGELRRKKREAEEK
jgi:hypothetical protein